MNDPTVKVAVDSARTGEPAKAAVPPVSDGIALTVRTRKVVRLAPPIDDGFRPFRVF
jgi:hypothetical protein